MPSEPSIESLEAASQSGDITSKRYLAWKYYSGDGVQTDLKKARELFEENSILGDMESRYYLADLLWTTGNKSGYFEHLRSAAVGEFLPAMFRLGVTYYNGRYLEKDTDEGINWIEKAAAGGHIYARRFLLQIEKSTSPLSFFTKIFKLVKLSIDAARLYSADEFDERVRK